MRPVAALVALSLAALLLSRADALARDRGQVFIGNGFAFESRPVIVPRSRVIVIERPFVRRDLFFERPIIIERPLIIERGFVEQRQEFFFSPWRPFP
jgi:hypothetical protein